MALQASLVVAQMDAAWELTKAQVADVSLIHGLTQPNEHHLSGRRAKTAAVLMGCLCKPAVVVPSDAVMPSNVQVVG